MTPQASVHPLSQARRKRMEQCGMSGENSAVLPERLREVITPFTDMNGVTQQGTLIVTDACAPYVAKICNALYARRFPIARMDPICMFGGDDEASMIANNSSAFNGRLIAGTNTLSAHAYGMAIDINPVQNPFIAPDAQYPDMLRILPPHAAHYVNRNIKRPGMSESVADIFAKNGFSVYGSYRPNVQDWHHFQAPRLVALCCAALPAYESAAFFTLSIDYSDRFSEDIPGLTDAMLQRIDSEGPEAFLSTVGNALKHNTPLCDDIDI